MKKKAGRETGVSWLREDGWNDKEKSTVVTGNTILLLMHAHYLVKNALYFICHE